jgi:phage shock protein PspC (stress-responsive transcriptional regulator)
MSSGNGITSDRTTVLVRSRRAACWRASALGPPAYVGIDVTLVRVIAAVITLIPGGAGALAYLAACAIIPQEGEKASLTEYFLGNAQGAS